jgi:hypothetical protein
MPTRPARFENCRSARLGHSSYRAGLSPLRAVPCQEGMSGETATFFVGRQGVADSSLQALPGRLPR